MGLCVGVLVVNFFSSVEFGDGCTVGVLVAGFGAVVLDSKVVDVGLMTVVKTVVGTGLVTALDGIGMVSLLP